MREGLKLKLGDPCPVCAGELKAAQVPTADQRKKADDRENREPLPPQFDTTSEDWRAEHGALYRCRDCGYITRFPIVEATPVAAATP